MEILWEGEPAGSAFLPDDVPVRLVLFPDGDSPVKPFSKSVSVSDGKADGLLEALEKRYRAEGVVSRKSIIEGMEHLDSSRLALMLQRLLAVERDIEVRCAIVDVLGRRGDPEDEVLVRRITGLLSSSRRTPVFFREVIHALVNLKAADATPDLLNLLGSDDIPVMGAVLDGLPDLLKHVDDSRFLERAVQRILSGYEHTEMVVRNLSHSADPVRAMDLRNLHESYWNCLKRITGVDYEGASDYRAWWNDRDLRARFLKEGIK